VLLESGNGSGTASSRLEADRLHPGLEETIGRSGGGPGGSSVAFMARAKQRIAMVSGDGTQRTTLFDTVRGLRLAAAL